MPIKAGTLPTDNAESQCRIRVEMMGLPGSGKTTLAQHLGKRLRLRTFLERHDENPFLHGRFGTRAAPSLENSIFFLVDDLATQYASEPDDLVLYDSGLLLDLAYARAMLPSADAELYSALVHHFLTVGFGASVVLDLRVPADVAAVRMRARGGARLSPSLPYLDALTAAIAAIEREFTDSCALLQIDASGPPEVVAEAAVRALVSLFPKLEARP